MMKADFLTPDLLGGSYLYADSASSDSVFGFAVSLTTIINPAMLGHVVNELMTRFPQFAVRVERAGSPTFVPDNSPVTVSCLLQDAAVGFETAEASVAAEKPGRLFSISYLHKSLFFNFHRALTDERGAMTFIRAVLFRYLSSCGFDVENDGSILTAEGFFNPFEAEDAFVKMDEIPASRPIWYMDAKAFAVPQSGQADGRTTVIRIPLNKMKARPRAYAEMTTAFIAPFFSDALQTEYIGQMAEDEYIVAAINVNLRHYFPTPSLRSFYTEVPLAYNRNLGEYPVDTVVMSQKKLLEAQLKTDALAYNAQSKIAMLEKVAGEKSSDKKIAMMAELMRKKAGRAAYSLCNVGNIIMPETLSRYVTEFYPVLPASIYPFTLTAAMLHGDMILTVTSDRDATAICRRFANILERHDFHAFISDKFEFPFMKYIP